MSKRKQPDRTPRIERYHGTPDYLPRPVPLVRGSKLMVVGVTKDSPESLWRSWLRESHERGIEAQH
jgi:hypothetical protein